MKADLELWSNGVRHFNSCILMKCKVIEQRMYPDGAQMLLSIAGLGMLSKVNALRREYVPVNVECGGWKEGDEWIERMFKYLSMIYRRVISMTQHLFENTSRI